MKFLHVMALAGAMLIGTFSAFGAEAPKASDCTATMTRAEFIATQLGRFGGEGIQIEPVIMEGVALNKFIASLLVDIKDNGYDPKAFEDSVKGWASIVWAKLADKNGQTSIGIAAFDKNGCLLEASIWNVQKFFETMRRAFGVDS